MECVSGYFLFQNNGKATCLGSCPTGTYANGQICSVCKATCTQCTTGSDCQKCATGYFMSAQSANTCNSACLSGEIAEGTAAKCYSPVLFPTGTVDFPQVTRLSLKYSLPIAKSSGTLALYQVNSAPLQGTLKDAVLLSIPVSDPTVTINDSTLTVSLPVGKVQYGGNYAVEVSAGSIKSTTGFPINSIPSTSWTFTINPYQLQPLVAVVNNGARSLEVRRDSVISLDAAGSLDPSGSYRTTDLLYDWVCFDVSQSYQNYRAQPLATWGGFVNSAVGRTDILQHNCAFWSASQHLNDTKWIQSDPSFSIDDVYAVQFLLSDNAQRQSSVFTYIRIIAAQAQSLYLSNTPKSRIDTNKPFKLNSLQLATGAGSYTLAWTWTSTVTAASPQFLTPLTNCWGITVGEGSLQPGGTYTFTLSYADSVASSSAVVEIVTNLPPSGGVLAVDNLSGTAILTLVQATMQGWSDSDVPLSFSFSFYQGIDLLPTLSVLLQGNSPLEYLLRGPLPDPSAQLLFPAGQLTLIGYCLDSLGGTGFATKSLSFEPTTEALKVIESANRIDKTVIDLGSAYQVANKILAIGLTAAALTEANEVQIAQIAQTLLSPLQVLFTYALPMFTPAIQQYASGTYLMRVLSMAIEPITRLRLSQESLTQVQSLLSIISPDQFSTSQTAAYTDSGQTITTTQELLSTKDFVSVAQALARASANLVKISGLRFDRAVGIYETATGILQLNGQVSETQRRLVTPDISAMTQKVAPNAIMNTTFTLSSAISVTFPIFSTNAPEVTINATVFGFNPFSDPSVQSLNTVVSVGVKASSPSDLLDLHQLLSPVLLNFSLSKSVVVGIASRVEQESGFLQGVRPDCIYWDYNISRFSPSGCGINNVMEVYEYFEDFSLMPESFVLQCACYHLSEFTVSFTSKATLQGSVFMLRDREEGRFALDRWESVLLLGCWIVLIVVYFATLSCAFYWDNFNPHFAGASVEAEKSYRYFDHDKVEAVLSQLEREFIKRLTHDKADSKVFISKILHSGLVGRLMTVFDSEDSLPDQRETEPPTVHAMQRFLRAGQDVDGLSDEVLDESPVDLPFSPSHRFRPTVDLQARLRGFLTKGIGDPRFLCTPVIMEDETLFDRVDFPVPSQRDEQETMDQLKHRLYILDVGSQEKTPVDQFLDKYDDFGKLKEYAQQHFPGKDRPLTEEDMAQLGYSEKDFAAVKFGNQGLVPDTTRLTGGEYAKKLVTEVKKFYYTVKVSYWSLCKLYFQKEHKFVALLSTLHIEYTKKQMLTFLFLYQLLNLMLCALFASYFDWNFSKEYSEEGKCYWGCNHEAQMIAGAVCAWIPWPVVYLVKYLCAKNVVDFGSTNAWK